MPDSSIPETLTPEQQQQITEITRKYSSLEYREHQRHANAMQLITDEFIRERARILGKSEPEAQS